MNDRELGELVVGIMGCFGMELNKLGAYIVPAYKDQLKEDAQYRTNQLTLIGGNVRKIVRICL